MPRVSRLSLELLDTFLRVLDHDGDAGAAARDLGINQPSMSKRLAVLQHAGRGLRRPWLERAGKHWRATEEGRRVLPAVRDIRARYERLTRFLDRSPAPPAFTFACGQLAAIGFVLRATQRFYREQPGEVFRISQLGGAARIEGVANGSLDLAAVTHDEEAIAAVALRELHIDALPPDPLVLVAPTNGQPVGKRPAWLGRFAKLSTRAVSADALRGLPLILPEPDSDIRRRIDLAARSASVLGEWSVLLEVGGWQTILAYVRAGLGVGVVTRSALVRHGEGLDSRPLDPKVFAPNRVRLVCRRRSAAADDLDLSAAAARFRTLLMEEATKGI